MYDGALADLIDQFGQLPGIGPKSAQRILHCMILKSSLKINKETIFPVFIL